MSPEQPQSDPLVGQTLLDKLKVIRKLGGGGMGAVYEVEHLITRHRRALKLIKPEYVKRRSYMRRLIREAGVAGQLQTPYVVETFDAGTMESGSAYVLMELLDGEQLIDLLEREEILSVPRLVGIMGQVCEGVAVAHRAGIIHRDLKPENIFLVKHPSGHERVKILDFGISKFKDKKDQTSRLTAEGTILGTPFYMSPEQAAAREVDERTDVYSVGVMMYEALTGRLPFDAKSVGALFIKIAAGEYLPLSHFRPDVPPELMAIVERAMHRDLEKRYQSMEALRAELVLFAPGDLRIRAKTISDSPKPNRSTVAYESDVPRIREREYEDEEESPARGTLSMGAPRPERGGGAISQETLAAPESERPREDGPARAEAARERAAEAALSRDPREPPAAEPHAHARPSSRGAWIAAAAILGVAVAVAVGFAVSGGDDREREPLPRDTEAAAPQPAVREQPAEPPAEARVETGEEPPEEATEPERAVRAPAAPTDSVRARVRPIERRRNPSDEDRAETPAERAGLATNPYGN